MNENIQALVKRVMENEELQSQFEKLETPEEAFELASKLQDGFTKEEFLEAVKGFAAFNEDITDDELAAIAGGENEADDPLGLSDKHSQISACVDITGIPPQVPASMIKNTHITRSPDKAAAI